MNMAKTRQDEFLLYFLAGKLTLNIETTAIHHKLSLTIGLYKFDILERKYGRIKVLLPPKNLRVFDYKYLDPFQS